MQRNQISLLENLEPKSLITNSNISFDSTTMTKMETIENRRDRAKYFLELCLNLQKEEQEMVITLLREIIVSSKEMPEVAELGKELNSLFVMFQILKNNCLTYLMKFV